MLDSRQNHLSHNETIGASTGIGREHLGLAMKTRMVKMTKIVLSLVAALSFTAEAKQTTYYTMLSKTGTVNKRECNMEGNQIVRGMLFGSGSQCRRGIPYSTKYCPWGIGNRDNCIVPCVHGAGHKSMVGRTVNVRGFRCPWGPLKGRWIEKVIIADVGGMVGKGHTDVFTGVCEKKKSDNCTEYADEGTIASYGRGKGREEEIAVALVNSFVRQVGQTEVASLIPGQSPVTAGFASTGGAPPSIAKPSPTSSVAQANGITSGFLLGEAEGQR